MTRASTLHRPGKPDVRVERRPLALRDAPAHLRCRMLACEADPESGRRPVEPGSAGVTPRRPLLAEIRDLFRRSPERCPRELDPRRA